MSEQQGRRLIADYLRRVEVALGGVPAAQRREILDDLQAHIDEALSGTPTPSDADVRNVLDRLGAPEELARDARERLGMVSEERVRAGGAGPLEIAAVVLTVIFFPVGILLAWMSDRWRTRDKVIATVVPIVGCALFVVGFFGAFATMRSGTVDSAVSQATAVTIPQEREDQATAPSGAQATPVQPSVEVVQTSERGSGNGVVELVLGLGLLVFALGSPLFAGVWLGATMIRRPAPLALVGMPA